MNRAVLTVLGLFIIICLVTYSLNGPRESEFYSKIQSNGSFIPLTDTMKYILHDPNSFEHVKTIYKDQLGLKKVIMTYRAKNGLGVLRLGHIECVSDEDGKILEIISE